MPDPIEDLEGFTMPTVTPMPAADVRRRGNKIRRRNNALAAVGGVAVVAAVTVPFAIFMGGQGGSAPQEPPVASSGPAEPARQTTIPDSFDLTAVPKGAPISFEAQDRPVIDDLQICGSVIFSTASTSDAAGASYQEAGTESAAGRTLAVYADDQAAAAALAAYRDGVDSCPVDQSTGGTRLEYEVVAPPPLSADDGFVYSERAHDGDLYYDLSVFEVARVGNAIFVGSTHGSVGGDQQVAAETERLGDLSEPVLSQLSVFSETGGEPAIGEGAVPPIPAGFPLAQGLPSGGTEGTVPAPDPNACGNTVQKAPDAVETAHAQWRDVSQIQDRQLMTFSSQAAAEAYVQRVAGVYCVDDDLGGGAHRVTRLYPGTVGDYSMGAVGHNELDGQVDDGLWLTQVVRVGRAVLLAQRIDEGYAWTGNVDDVSDQLISDGFAGLGPVVDAMCEFTETGC